MPIGTTPEKVAARLLQATRDEGVETALQVALDLTYVRWLEASTPAGWEDFMVWWNGGLALRSDGDLGDGWDAWSDIAVPPQLDFEGSPFALNDSEEATSPSRKLMIKHYVPQSRRHLLVSVFDHIVWHHPQDQWLREYLHGVFEELLTIRSERVARAGAAHASRSEIAKLMSALVGDGARLLDPACGLGASLLDSAPLRSSVKGIEVSERVAQTARARFTLAGVDADIQTADWLTTDDRVEWDAITLEPPFSVKLSPEQLLSNPLFGSRSVLKTDMIWLVRASQALSLWGRAVVLLPASTLSSPIDRHYRSALLDEGRVEAIVSLPRGASLGTGIDTCLWILRGANDPAKSDAVLLVNGGKLFDGLGAETSSETNTLIDLVLAWRRRSECTATERWRAAVVHKDELIRTGTAAPADHLVPAPATIEPRPEPSGRLFTELRIAGFKAVGDPADIPLRPLTLLFGRNSAGKSSLIQSLLLLRQSLSEPHLVTRADGVDLGSYRGLVHRHQSSRSVRIGVSFASTASLDSSLGVPHPSYGRAVDVQFEAMMSGGARSSEVEVTMGGRSTVFRRSPDEDADGFVVAAEDVARLVAFATEGTFSYPAVRAIPDAYRRIERVLGGRPVNVSAQGSVPGPDPVFGPVNTGIVAGLEEGLLRRGIRATGSVLDELTALFGRTRYLGPLRQPPQRTSVRSESARGETDLPFFLLDNASERDQVSRWMNKLGIAYDLDVFSLANTQGAHILGDIVSVVLKNERTGVTLSTADVGFGVSQVLPILVELSARSESVILIEQPEIHLHPAMQSELADILIESTDPAGRGNQIIAETHSEHIMLRVQRRIREHQLDANQVAVIYVDQDEAGQLHAKHLRLDDDGDFVDDWPNGFFAERFDELFGGLT